MPLYALGDLRPQLGPGAWAAPSADLISDVHLGAPARLSAAHYAEKAAQYAEALRPSSA